MSRSGGETERPPAERLSSGASRQSTPGCDERRRRFPTNRSDRAGGGAGGGARPAAAGPALRGEPGTAGALQTRPLGPQQLSVGPQSKRLLPKGLQV